ncbi:MAG: TA system VapC family ribonuclease toxin [Hydrogenophaga sp.]
MSAGRGAAASSAREVSGRYLVDKTTARIGLLDVNVLIALCDGRHEHHLSAAQWFVDNAAHGWASCPLTQNGAIRIMSTPAYPGARPVSQVLEQVKALCASAHHHFWPDAVSLTDGAILNPSHLLGHRQLTDAYLLALAVHRRGQFVTLDGAIPLKAVHGTQATDVVRLI